MTVALPLMGTMLYVLNRNRAEPVPVKLTAGPSQPRVSPEEAGIDLVALEQAATYAAERNTSALVVVHGGHVAFEKYWNGTTADSVLETGFDPALVALAIGSALNDRVIATTDEPLSNYLGERAGEQGGIALRELLARDHAELALRDTVDLLAMTLESATKLPYQSAVAERLWTPVGGGDLEFRKGKDGRRQGGVRADCCLRARLDDWMRIGEALANDGVFEGNQLTPPRYIGMMLAPAHKDATRGYFTRLDGDFAARDVAWLEGTHNQRMWIVPSLRLAIIRVGGEPSADKGWDERMIPDTIIRGMRDWHPAGANEGVDPNKFAPH